MLLRQCDRRVYDVFLGTGFDQWSRVQKYHWGVKVIDGYRLPRQELNEVNEAILQHPHGSFENVV